MLGNRSQRTATARSLTAKSALRSVGGCIKSSWRRIRRLPMFDSAYSHSVTLPDFAHIPCLRLFLSLRDFEGLVYLYLYLYVVAVAELSFLYRNTL